MQKTPDEVKKALVCCIETKCYRCPYFTCLNEYCLASLQRDALALIQQYEPNPAKEMGSA